jgi:hypothetical protein
LLDRHYLRIVPLAQGNQVCFSSVFLLLQSVFLLDFFLCSVDSNHVGPEVVF